MSYTELKSLKEIFDNKCFRIPDYQRGYAWGTSQLNAFWEDILNFSSKNYYMGVLSLQAIESASNDNELEILRQSSYEPYFIIDGQQRLLTCVILINELLNYFTQQAGKELYSLDERDISLGTSSNIADERKHYIRIKPNKLDTSCLILSPTDSSTEYFKHLLLNKSFGALETSLYTANLNNTQKFFQKK